MSGTALRLQRRSAAAVKKRVALPGRLGEATDVSPSHIVASQRPQRGGRCHFLSECCEACARSSKTQASFCRNRTFLPGRA